MADFRAARIAGAKVAVLTCYDFSTARLMHSAGVPVLLVGDSAANVILGHDTTLPVSLEFMIELTAAVRRGAPLAMVMGDLPFGSYGGDASRGFDAATRMVKLSGCDCVKIEVNAAHAKLITDCADAGIAVVSHLGLKPQSVSLVGGYKFQGRTASEALAVVTLARQMEQAGAAMILLEAVPSEVSERVVASVGIPVIGCGAGPACHGCVIVTPDAIGFNSKPPRFVPHLANIAQEMQKAFSRYVSVVQSGEYPAAGHQYEMQPDEKRRFLDK